MCAMTSSFSLPVRIWSPFKMQFASPILHKVSLNIPSHTEFSLPKCCICFLPNWVIILKDSYLFLSLSVTDTKLVPDKILGVNLQHSWGGCPYLLFWNKQSAIICFVERQPVTLKNIFKFIKHILINVVLLNVCQKLVR